MPDERERAILGLEAASERERTALDAVVGPSDRRRPFCCGRWSSYDSQGIWWKCQGCGRMWCDDARNDAWHARLRADLAAAAARAAARELPPEPEDQDDGSVLEVEKKP